MPIESTTIVRRAPWTLWRYMIVELLRLGALTTAIIVAVIAFAATVKFFADGQLGPVETVQFMILAMVPMVQYALPFAGCFAATLVYHRMSCDHELSAASAGGIGWVGLLTPALVCGVVVSVALAVLIQFVIPKFLLSMERMVTVRVGSFIENSIERGEPVVGGNRMLFADSVVRKDARAGSDAEAELLLVGVVVCELDSAGRPEWCAASRSAEMAVFSGGPVGTDGGTVVGARLRDVAVWDRSGAARMSEQTLSFPVSGGFQDDPKFLTFTELRGLKDNPDRMNFIRRYARDLQVHLAEREATSRIDSELRGTGRAQLSGGDEFEVTVYGSGIRWSEANADWEVMHGTGGRARVEVSGPLGTAWLAADRAGIGTELTPEFESRRLMLRVDLSGNVESHAPDGTPGGVLSQRRFSGLSLRGQSSARFESPPPARELVSEVRGRVERTGEDAFLRGPLRALEFRLFDLAREATSKMHERWAASVSCIVMLLTGAVTAIRLRNATPLGVYLWSFFPALVVVLTISIGQQVMHSAGAAGGILLWGGVVGLGLYTIAAGAIRCAR